MEKLIFITGGARSGKSAFAQRLAQELEPDDVAYIATAEAGDDEMRDRIEKHRKGRPAHWVTYEAPYNLDETIRGKKHALYLLDCMTVYLSNRLLSLKSDWSGDVLPAAHRDKLENDICVHIDSLLCQIQQLDRPFIIVSNEVGLGVVPASAMGRVFRDIAGRVNQQIAAAAHEAHFVAAGLPMQIK